DALLPGHAVVREVVDAEHVTFTLERTDNQLDAVARRKKDLLGADGSFDESAVGANDLEREPAEREADVAGARRVHDAPALDLSGRDRELGLGRAVDQAHIAFAAIVAIYQTAELRDLSALVDAQIVEDEDLRAVERQFVCSADDQRSVESLLQLLGLIEMRVIPERAGVRRSEAVGEGLARL